MKTSQEWWEEVKNDDAKLPKMHMRKEERF